MLAIVLFLYVGKVNLEGGSLAGLTMSRNGSSHTGYDLFADSQANTIAAIGTFAVQALKDLKHPGEVFGIKTDSIIDDINA